MYQYVMRKSTQPHEVRIKSQPMMLSTKKAFVHFRSIVYLHFFIVASSAYGDTISQRSSHPPHRKINMYRIELKKCRLSEMKLFHAPMNTITETIPPDTPVETTD